MAKVSKSDPAQYTKPEVRDKIKQEVTAGDKGGKPGQWSARKAQLVTHEYENKGGGYKKEKNASQKNLKKWGDEKWTTADGQKAARKGGTTRYLPKQAWDQLSDKEKTATNRKKVQGSQAGQQFVSNTTAAAKARKKASGTKAATKKKATKKASAKKAPAKKATAKKAAAKKRSS